MKTLALLFLLVIGPTMSEEAFLAGKIPPRPVGGIYDPEQWLTSEARSEMLQNVAIARDKWGAEVFVIILPKKLELEDPLFTRKVAKEWGGGDLWGIVLNVIGDPGFPVFLGRHEDSYGWNVVQKQSFDSSLAQALEDVKSRALREEDQLLQVQTGTRELTDELRYLGLIKTRIDQRHAKAGSDFAQVRQTEQSNKKSLSRLLSVGIPLVLILLGFLWFFISRKRKERRVNFHFPETSPRLRFHAPWSGGGNVTVKFSSRLREDGSSKG